MGLQDPRNAFDEAGRQLNVPFLWRLQCRRRTPLWRYPFCTSTGIEPVPNRNSAKRWNSIRVTVKRESGTDFFASNGCLGISKKGFAKADRPLNLILCQDTLRGFWRACAFRGILMRRS